MRSTTDSKAICRNIPSLLGDPCVLVSEFTVAKIVAFADKHFNKFAISTLYLLERTDMRNAIIKVNLSLDVRF